MDTRLSFALRNLEHTDWPQFEDFATAFLAPQYPNLRRLTGPGDLGRDAELHASDGVPLVVFQYSVTEDWRDKIKSTVRRLHEAEVAFNTLIYVTNRDIGFRADDLKAEFRKAGIGLDILDASWFVSRREVSDATRAASARIESLIVDPLLPTADLVSNTPISAPELRSGLLYIELQLHDVAQNRGLTKTAFEALVLSVLAPVPDGDRVSRDSIRTRVRSILETADPSRVAQLVDGALERLKSADRVTFTARADTFALHHRERVRLAEQAAAVSVERSGFRTDLAAALREATGRLEIGLRLEEKDQAIDAVEATIEDLLSVQGNEFVSSWAQGSTVASNMEVRESATRVVFDAATELNRVITGSDLVLLDLVEVVTDAVVATLRRPGPFAARRLRDLADSYTLLAFLQETPDVQKAVGRLFSRGLLVLDATVLLPCFVESQLPREQRRFTNLLAVARQAGIELAVTRGVMNEIDTHLTNAVLASRIEPEWRGRLPMVYRQWKELLGTGSFSDFVGQFRGARPVDDLLDFLASEIGLELIDLERAVDRLPSETRWAITEHLREAKGRQRQTDDPMSLDLLVNHDVEMLVGVLGLRTTERADAYGHEHWVVTSDSSLFALQDRPTTSFNLASRPCMHPNFLGNLLAIGPARRALRRDLRALMPVALDIQGNGWGVASITEKAIEIRARYAGKPEYFIRRKTREDMDKIKGSRTLFDESLTEVELVPVVGETDVHGAPVRRAPASSPRPARPSRRNRR
jgi:hypothetical protein